MAGGGREVWVIGVGMMTAVGLTAAETAGSVRAGTARFAPVAWLDKRFEPFVLASVPDDGLPDLELPAEAREGLSDRESRMLRLGALPLAECLSALPERTSVGLHLALPETESARPLDCEAFLRAFALQTAGAFDAASSRIAPSGRAGGLVAIAAARSLIAEGKADALLVGGIDTYRSLHVLGGLDLEGRVKSSTNRDGFIPGEGAGFVLLARREWAEARGCRPAAAVSAAAAGAEPGHLYSSEPYRAGGLAGTIASLAPQEPGAAPVAEVYSSMNGESHWGKEWGVARIRNGKTFDPDHAMHHPADCFGDVGSACGPILTGLAALGISGGYRKAPCLVLGSSDRGDRAAVRLRAA